MSRNALLFIKVFLRCCNFKFICSSSYANKTKVLDTSKLKPESGHTKQIDVLLAHEVNQPLSVIMLNAEMAKKLIKAGSGSANMANLEVYLDRIIDNSEYVNQIIKVLGSYKHSTVIGNESVDLATLVYEAADFLIEDFQKQSVTINYQIANNPLIVQGNRTQLIQVLINIYRNAIEAVQGRDLREIYLDVFKKDGFVVIRIQDTGLGFSAEALKMIGSVVFTTKKAGFGVGILLSKTFIEQQSGQLHLSNSKTGSACVDIKLPVL
ncbi:MAG: ATP-binding protein [Methylococcales bacterium]|nr:ATP-binding protein [Methylococcales bacterium]